MFWVALQRSGSVVSSATPVARGPRHCGQSAADREQVRAATMENPNPAARCIASMLTLKILRRASGRPHSGTPPALPARLAPFHERRQPYFNLQSTAGTFSEKEAAVFLPDVERQPRERELPGNRVNDVDLAGVETGRERVGWHLELEDSGA